MRKFSLVFLGILAVAIALAYSNCFGVGFVFDDTYGLVQNPSIRSLANIPRFFVDPYLLTIHRENIDVRPVLQATFALNYAISGLNPWSWRVLNLVVHFANAAMVFFIVRDFAWWPRSESARWPAAAASLIFALSPLGHQAVVYFWARSALLCTCFYLGAFLAFQKRRFWLCGVLFALALLTKTIAVTLPLTLLAYEYVDNGFARLRSLARPLAALLVVLALFLVYRGALLPAWAEKTRHEAWVTPWIWFMTQWSAYWEYLRLFIWPDALSLDHDFPYNVSFLTARTLVSLAATLLWLGVALFRARRWQVFSFATAWFFLTLATESTVAPISETINDHRPYIATALGMALLLALLLHWLSRGRPALLAGMTAALACAAIPLVRHRNYIWQDGVRLWVDTAQTSPRNGRAQMNAGKELMARGQLAEARAYFERSLKIFPDYSFLHMNLSVLARAEGKPAEELREAREAVRLAPGLALAHFYLGEALRRAGQFPEARVELEKAQQISPETPGVREALRSLADPREVADAMKRGIDALYVRDDAPAAVAAFSEVLAKDPQNYEATRRLAAALDRAGRREDGRKMWRIVMQMATARGDAATLREAQERLAQK